MAVSDEEAKVTAASRKNYRAFLLRCWREKADGGAEWRFTLVQINGGQSRLGFAGLEALMDYLGAELGVSERTPWKSARS